MNSYVKKIKCMLYGSLIEFTCRLNLVLINNIMVDESWLVVFQCERSVRAFYSRFLKIDDITFDKPMILYWFSFTFIHDSWKFITYGFLFDVAVLQTAFLQISPEEANPCRTYRNTLSQLRFSFYSSLHSYRERI